MDKNKFLKEIRNHTTSQEILCDFIEENSKEFNDDEKFLIEFVNVCPMFIYLINKEQITENVFSTALNRLAGNIFDDHKSLSPLFNRQQSMLLDEDFLVENASMFTRELYLKCKHSILRDSGKIHRYLGMFYSLLNKDDALEIYNICISNDIDLGHYTKGFILVKLAKHELLTKEQLVHVISIGILKFKRLDIISRHILATEALDFSEYNFKYLSVEDKLKLENFVDFVKNPMLTGYIANKSILNSKQWLEIAELDQRAMRFLPSSILSDHSIMSDDFLIGMIKKQNRYFLYAKIIPFINQISPERLSLKFCKMLKEHKLTEYNHPVIQKIIKSHKVNIEKVYNLKIKKNVFKLNKQQMLSLKEQINLKLL
jgi:hypothetical protein